MDSSDDNKRIDLHRQKQKTDSVGANSKYERKTKFYSTFGLQEVTDCLNSTAY